MIGITLRPLRVAWHAGVLAGLFCLALGPASAAPPVTVSQPWFRYLLPNIPAGGYLTLDNHTPQTVHLTGASSSACGMLMLHKTVHENGVEKMVAVPEVTIPAHGSFSFHPGFYHIMCMKPHMKVGETVPVTLTFDHTPPLTIDFPVYGAMGKTSDK